MFRIPTLELMKEYQSQPDHQELYFQKKNDFEIGRDKKTV